MILIILTIMMILIITTQDNKKGKYKKVVYLHKRFIDLNIIISPLESLLPGRLGAVEYTDCFSAEG